MNKNQENILKLLSKLSDGQYYKIEPAGPEKIKIFKEKSTAKGVDAKVIDQLVDLYEVADGFYSDIVIGFHGCTEDILFEWWDEKELWLGQRDFNTLRWANGKFCLGDASSISYSDDYESDSLIGLIEICMKEIENADNQDKSTGQ
ncbi:MAG: hypothetical protein ABJ092_14720 [Gillisia sp.]